MNPELADALAKLNALADKQPQEPFLDLKRRPNGYRETPAYQQWQSDSQVWQQAVTKWMQDGVTTIATDDSAAVLFYGSPVPGARFEKQPDGAIAMPGYGHSNAPRWMVNLDLPGPRIDLEKWARDLCNWRLKGMIQQHLEDIGAAPIWHEANYREYADHATTQWAHGLRSLVDYRLLSRLHRLTGESSRGLTLTEYNIAVKCGHLLDDLNQTNPGIAGWWLGILFRAFQQPMRQEPTAVPTPEQLPDHPGAIIAQAKASFQQAGGKHWKALAAQPADDVFKLIARFPVKDVAWLTGILDQAQLPLEEITLRLPPAPETEPQPAQLTLMPTAEPVINPAKPKPRYRKGARRIQPPYTVKRQIIETRRSVHAPDATLTAAHQRMATLACREFAGRHRARPDLISLFDYIKAHPQAAGRRATWRTLHQASREWHDEIAQQDRDRRRGVLTIDKLPGENLEWNSALDDYATAHFRAAALTSSEALLRETNVMQHCVGRGGYDRDCVNGRSLIFHLEPADIQPDDESDQHRRATTVELHRESPEGQWRVRQHQGYRNRRATPQETAWAKQLVKAYETASQPDESAAAMG